MVRGARPGAELIALDNSGWEIVVRLETCQPELCSGVVIARRLAAEPRTKIAVYQALLHPADYRRLIAEGTALGVVAFMPLISDRCVVPRLDEQGALAEAADWPLIARDAAEVHDRGRCPVIGRPVLFDQALDQVQQSGAAILLAHGGVPVRQVVSHRPFSVDLLCPPRGGFSPQEIRHAQERGVAVVETPANCGMDPVEPTLAMVRLIRSLTES